MNNNKNILTRFKPIKIPVKINYLTYKYDVIAKGRLRRKPHSTARCFYPLKK